MPIVQQTSCNKHRERQLTTIAIAIIVLMSLLPISAWAVNFRALAPSRVEVDQPFQIQYVVDDHASSLQPPSWGSLQVLAGPYTSSSSSYTYINGQRSSAYQQTYTYTVMASKPGTYSIPAASIQAGGHTIKSNGLKITVSRAEDPQPAHASAPATSSDASDNAPRERAREREHTRERSELFIRTIVSKNHVREQEALTLEYRIYLAGIPDFQLAEAPKLPDFTGFLKQEVDLGQLQVHSEQYNGRTYATATLYKTRLYPQHAGTIDIPATDYAVIIPVRQAHGGGIFDDFFDTYTNVRRDLTAPAATITVDALPETNKPSNFSGGVGAFSLTPSISATSVTQHDPVTIRLDITGNGNLKLLKTPDIHWPEGFDTYDPKVTNSYHNTDEGMTGTKTIEYLAIPREAGDYTVPPITLSYYNSQSGRYETLSTPEYHLHVARGTNTANANVQDYSQDNQETLQQVANDVRYIHTNPIETSNAPATIASDSEQTSCNRHRAADIATYLWYLLPLVLALLAAILLRRYLRLTADIVGTRSRRAGRVAHKRLRTAEQLLKAGDTTHFYEEIERAILSYLSDRMAIPMSDMSKEQISDLMRTRGIADEQIQATLDVISSAEFARYAPSAATDMHTLYDNTTTLINTLEAQ